MRAENDHTCYKCSNVSTQVPKKRMLESRILPLARC